MKKGNKRNPMNGTICIGIIMILMVLLYFFFLRIFKNDQAKEELNQKILNKEKEIEDLLRRLQNLKQLKQALELQAIQIYKAVKLMVVVIIIAIGFVCFAVFSFSVWGSIASIIAASGVVYKAVTIIFQNKVGDFNVTLILLEKYFIERTFRKNAFEPALIAAIEEKIDVKKEELVDLKNEYQSMTL